MAEQGKEQIASDEALARYLQYGSDDEGNENTPTTNPLESKQEEGEDLSDSESESEEYDESEDDSDEEEEGDAYSGNYDQRERPTNATVTRKSTNARFVATQVAPQGLHATHITDAALLADSLREANSVFDGECAGQIASNTHFFVNLPFPIGGTREAGTTIFDLDDVRIPRLSELIRHSLHKLSFVAGGKKVMHEGMLARANIIVRRYSKGQHISFHIDERECASAVFGFILQNDHPQHKGLEFRRGEDKKQLSYVMQEHPGTAFILTHEARYKWRHGLPPVTACRVSVTCRFFKTDVFANYRTSLGLPKPLKSWQQRRLKRETEAKQQEHQEPQEQNPQQTQPLQAQPQKTQPTQKAQPQKPEQTKPQSKPQTEQASEPKRTEKVPEPKKPEDIHVELCLNKDSHQTKPALVSPKVDIKQLIAAAKNKLRVKAKKFFAEGGVELTAGHELHPGDTVYVSIGEDFNAANKIAKKPVQAADAQSQNEDPNAGFGIAVVRERMAWWSAYRYAQLRFWIAQDPSGRTESRGTPVTDAAELGQLVASSHLSIPEMREVVLALRATVEDPQNGLTWGFHTAEWEDGRSTSICVLRPADGAWVEFVAEGKPTIKGARKRDGPLWKLEGGLNNPAELQSGGPVKLLSEVAAEVTQDLHLPAKGSHKTQVDRGDEDDVARRKRKPKKKKEQNAYQSKRGVEFTDKYVLFAGTVWCSSYYTCSIDIDGINYTSSTQFVMSEQARLFGDEARRQELLAASNAAAPHREFDHKAPKTGVRRVNNFDAEVWKTYKERLMWRGTYEKFTQNPTLKHKALEAGTRTFVEATEDPMWGIGICLSHPDAKNEQRWRGPNLMGRLLTALARLLRAEQVAPDALSPARVAHLRELAQELASDAGDLVAFGDRALNQTGDPDLFPVPGWPGTQAVRDATEWCKKSNASVDSILSGLSTLAENQEDLRTHRHALLYLVEGVLGIRWL